MTAAGVLAALAAIAKSQTFQTVMAAMVGYFFPNATQRAQKAQLDYARVRVLLMQDVLAAKTPEEKARAEKALSDHLAMGPVA